jgi:arabinogalactan endo-1,4-beta-galactosidase
MGFRLASPHRVRHTALSFIPDSLTPRALRSSYGRVAIAVLLASASAPALAAYRTAPVAIHGEAVIEPVQSNLAGRFWTSVSASSGSASAALAIDDDPATAWVAASATPGEWLELDLGGRYDNVRKLEVVFPDPGATYQYLIEASTDSRLWEAIADRSDHPTRGRGAVHLFTRPGTRYLRVTFSGASSGARVGLAEIRVFNYLRDDLVLGADLSWVDNFQNRNYYVSPNPSLTGMGAGPHLLDVVKDRGMSFIRLRIFNEPRAENTGSPLATPYQGPERSALSARWVKERGMELGIDFHYADSWADPGKQPKPRGWAELEFDQLVTALHDFTYAYLRTLVEQGTTPDKVAIGNEIINGFLWGSEGVNPNANPPYFREEASVYQSMPGGGILWRYWGSADPLQRQQYDQSWDRFTTLIAAGIAAARAASPESRIELHTIVGSGEGDRSGLDKTMEFWQQLLSRVNAKGQEPDVLAISYYPEWHGTVEQLDLNLHTIATAFPRYQVHIAETAYPAAGDSPQPNSTFPRTIQGQADAIRRVFQAANDLIDNRGVGVLVWEPASFQSMFRAVPEMPNHFEPLASIDVFNRTRATHILEHNVYVSARRGQSPPLPATVAVLHTADGSLGSVPVVWDVPSAADANRSGEARVQGSTPYGRVTAVVDLVE